MTHQLSLPDDLEFFVVYLAAVVVLISVLLFAVQVRDISRRTAKE